METDLVIIGSGIAGVAAFYKAKELGFNPVIVSKGEGATSLSSGAFDFLNSPLMRNYNPQSTVNFSFEENLILNIQQNNFHPYLVISKNFSDYSDFLDFVKNSTSDFFSYLKRYGINIEGSFSQSLLLLNSLGTYKYSNFALKTIKDGNLLSLKDEKIIFLGILKFPDFNSNFIAKSVSFLSSIGILPNFKSISYANIDIDSLFLPNVFYFAEKLEEGRELKNFIESLKIILKGKDFTAIAFPSVLGVEKSEEIQKEISENLGVKCFEILPSLPSVPGLRLQKVFNKIAGENKIQGKVIRVNIKNKNVESLVVKNEEKEFEIKAKVYILCSGEYIGGGIKFKKRLREEIFNLPLFYQEEKVGNKNIFNLTDEKITEEQKIFSIGVKVNNRLQPVDEKGEIIYNNLFVAGSILSGYNYSREKCGMGTALITGVFASVQGCKYV